MRIIIRSSAAYEDVTCLFAYLSGKGPLHYDYKIHYLWEAHPPKPK